MNRHKAFVFLLALNLFVPWESCYSSVGFLPRLFPRLFPKPHIENVLRNQTWGGGRDIVYSLIGRDPRVKPLGPEDEVQIIRDFIGGERNPHLDALPYERKVDGRILRHRNVHEDVKRAMIALSLGEPEAERNAFDLAKKIRDLLESAKVERIKRQEIMALQKRQMDENVPSLDFLKGEYRITFEYMFMTHEAHLEVDGESGTFCLTAPERCIRGQAVINKSVVSYKGSEGTLEINLRRVRDLNNFSAPVSVPGFETIWMDFQKIKGS